MVPCYLPTYIQHYYIHLRQFTARHPDLVFPTARFHRDGMGLSFCRNIPSAQHGPLFLDRKRVEVDYSDNADRLLTLQTYLRNALVVIVSIPHNVRRSIDILLITPLVIGILSMYTLFNRHLSYPRR